MKNEVFPVILPINFMVIFCLSRITFSHFYNKKGPSSRDPEKTEPRPALRLIGDLSVYARQDSNL